MLRVVLHALRQGQEGGASGQEAAEVAHPKRLDNPQTVAAHADPEPSVRQSPRSAAGTKDAEDNQTRPATRTTASTAARPPALNAKSAAPAPASKGAGKDKSAAEAPSKLAAKAGQPPAKAGVKHAAKAPAKTSPAKKSAKATLAKPKRKG